jgi:hypothetical protein
MGENIGSQAANLNEQIKLIHLKDTTSLYMGFISSFLLPIFLKSVFSVHETINRHNCPMYSGYVHQIGPETKKLY